MWRRIDGLNSYQWLLFKVQEDVVFDKILLLDWIHLGHGFELTEMRPAVFVYPFHFVKATGGQQTAYGHMHQILFLFLAEFFSDLSEFLDSDQEEKGFQIGFFAKPVYDGSFQIPPALLQVVVCEHAAKIDALPLEQIDFAC